MVRALWSKHRSYTNETAWLVAEFNWRRRLSKLGFTQSLNELDCYRAEGFLIISEELDDLERKKHEQEMLKSRKGR